MVDLRDSVILPVPVGLEKFSSFNSFSVGIFVLLMGLPVAKLLPLCIMAALGFLGGEAPGPPLPPRLSTKLLD